MAAASGSTKLCILLLNRGADVNAEGSDGKTLLHLAVASGCPVLCTLAKAPDGQSPLHRAVASGDTNLCTFFLNRGADVNLQRSDGKTPLHLAATSGSTKLCTLLLN
eukprot:Rhum_TRINITY_DN5608_c0_g1::Rhum_TRINITY_DN5608_c0_g1_i2::g.17836::m.17836